MGSTERLARGCAARPRLTLALWGVAVLIALVLVATSLRGLSSQGNVEGSPESTKAKDAIARAFPGVVASEKQDVIVATSSRYTVDSPQFRAFARRLQAALAATGEVRGAREVAVSRDGHSALVSVQIRSDSGAHPVEQVVEDASSRTFEVGITGFHSTGYDFGKQSQTDLEKGELAFGLPAALIVLVLVFGAVFAGLVPVLMAILSIIVALGLVAVISLEFSLSVFIVNMLTGMGLALGIDYSLFVVSRYREERGHGLAKEDAIARTGATASRAVLFSGSTFVIALLGMFIVPTSIMRSLALGAILVGIVSVAAALTLLPALLSIVGDRVELAARPVPGPQSRPRGHGRRGRLLAPHRQRRLAPAGALARGVRRRDARPRRADLRACTSARTASARCRRPCPRSRATSCSSVRSPPRTLSPFASSLLAATPPVCAEISCSSTGGWPRRAASARARSSPGGPWRCSRLRCEETPSEARPSRRCVISGRTSFRRSSPAVGRRSTWGASPPRTSTTSTP